MTNFCIYSAITIRLLFHREYKREGIKGNYVIFSLAQITNSITVFTIFRIFLGKSVKNRISQKCCRYQKNVCLIF